ncbi:hypothetical protein OGATHE_004354 [Ogataea polymorpha]|uniref:Uncharacterized protein n=1 Tax=Ogataea polymorpha TaxID=460523 RepID=A0A9P8T1G7_9ASCO|nr:hypothetical protein OGATHE_004354 [Ogataea polymorpha]
MLFSSGFMQSTFSGSSSREIPTDSATAMASSSLSRVVIFAAFCHFLAPSEQKLLFAERIGLLRVVKNGVVKQKQPDQPERELQVAVHNVLGADIVDLEALTVLEIVQYAVKILHLLKLELRSLVDGTQAKVRVKTFEQMVHIDARTKIGKRKQGRVVVGLELGIDPT